MLVDNVGGVASMWHVKCNGVPFDTGLHYICLYSWPHACPVPYVQNSPRIGSAGVSEMGVGWCAIKFVINQWSCNISTYVKS